MLLPSLLFSVNTERLNIAFVFVVFSRKNPLLIHQVKVLENTVHSLLWIAEIENDCIPCNVSSRFSSSSAKNICKSHLALL